MGFDSTFKRFWEKGRRIDPLTHKALEAIVKQDSKNVGKIARGLSGAVGGEGSWLGRRFGDLGDEADKNVADPVRGVGRAAATAGAVFGGMALAGGGAGAGGAAAAEGAGVGGGLAGGTGLTAATTGPTGTGLALGATGGGTGAGLSTAGTTAGGYATGLSSTGLGSSGAAASGFSPQFQRLLAMRQQPQQPRPLDIEEVEVPENPYIEQIALSSKQAKRPAKTLGEAIQRGARQDNPIDANGVQIAAIKALAHRIAKIRQRMQQRGRP